MNEIKKPASATPTAPPQPKWLDEIGYYDDLKVQKFRILIYGFYGAGKTSFAATAPKPLFIDTDKGGLVLRKKADIPFIPCYETRGILARVLGVLKAAETQTGPFAPGGQLADRETIIFDSFSTFSTSALADIGYKLGSNPLETKSGYDEYGLLLQHQLEMGKLFKRLNVRYNIIVTALPKIDKDEQTGAMIALPNVQGQYRDLMGADFDEVYYLQKTAGKRILRTTKEGLYDAKTRLGLKPEYVIPDGQPLTWDTLFKDIL